MIVWNQGLEALGGVRPDLVEPIRQAHGRVRTELSRIDMTAWPRTIVHGDFTPWNLRRPDGVIDFDLCHLGTRPWEFAIARCQRSPLVIDGYRDEALRLGFPLSREEEAGTMPCYRGLKVLMIATELHTGLVSGRFDIPMIEAQLAKTAFGL
jgi:homoserine kinase type II